MDGMTLYGFDKHKGRCDYDYIDLNDAITWHEEEGNTVQANDLRKLREQYLNKMEESL